jgi:methylase of polypeptide subunit release factors
MVDPGADRFDAILGNPPYVDASVPLQTVAEPRCPWWPQTGAKETCSR